MVSADIINRIAWVAADFEKSKKIGGAFRDELRRHHSSNVRRSAVGGEQFIP
jgi:hypothetical protein